MLVATKPLLWQTFCPDKQNVVTSFVTTSLLLSRQTQTTSFVTTNIILSWQKFCQSKHTFVAPKMCFVTTNMCLSQQTHVCHDKTFVATKIKTCGSSCQWQWMAIQTQKQGVLRVQVISGFIWKKQEWDNQHSPPGSDQPCSPLHQTCPQFHPLGKRYFASPGKISEITTKH